MADNRYANRVENVECRKCCHSCGQCKENLYEKSANDYLTVT